MSFGDLWLPLAALVLSLLLTPVVGAFANRFNVVAIPGGRHQHGRMVPKLGGIAIYLSFTAVTLFVFPWSAALWQILGSALLFLLIGALDDAHNISFWSKLLAQLAAAITFTSGGLEIMTIGNPWTSALLSLGMWSTLITVLWIITVVNVVNLSDGIDGLVPGVTVISAVVLALLSFKTGNIATARLALILAGSTAGLLFYNFHPAKIFLGDSGTMMIGFLLAIFGFLGGAKIATAMLILGIPILDGFFIILYRWSLGKSIFQPDRNHLHFRLLDRGLSAPQICYLFYGASAVLGGLAIFMSGRWKIAALAALILFFAAGVAWLAKWERQLK